MRANIKGSVWQIADKKGIKVDPESSKAIWRIQLYVGKKPDPKNPNHLIYDRRYETFRGNKNKAGKRLKKLSQEISASLDKGIPVPSGRLTVGELLRAWLNSKADKAPKTQESYQSIVEGHLIPALGHIQLIKLRSEAIQAYYAKAQEKPLSARSVHYHHRLLKQALKYAVWQNYIGINPCDRVKPPRPQKRTKRTLEASEVQVLKEAAKDNQFYPVIYTAVSSGLRRNELLGLRWRDVSIDTEKPTISVSRTLYKSHGKVEFREPKTERSRRCISITNKLAAYLKDYKADKESLNLHLGRLLSLDDLVFCNADGKPFDPHVVSHNFARIAKRAGFQGVRLHDLRHTFATLALKRGILPKIVSDALGHASVAFTMDTYVDTIPQEAAMALLNEVLPEG
jgi:integrase